MTHVVPIWNVPKVEHDESRSVGPIITPSGWIHRSEGTSDPEHTRFYAAQLLAAADEAERRMARSAETGDDR